MFDIKFTFTFYKCSASLRVQYNNSKKLLGKMFFISSFQLLCLLTNVLHVDDLLSTVM